MPVVATETSEVLPSSHFFISVTHSKTIRTVRLPRRAVQLGIAGSVLVTLWLVASSLYLLFHDDLVSGLMAREAAAQYAYEDRIAALRSQVEREASLKLVGQTTLEGRLKELAARAASLETRAGLLDSMADRPVRGVPTAGADPAATAPVKPQVEGRASAAEPSFNVRVAGVEERLERIDAAQFRTLGSISAAAKRRADALRAAFLSSGVSVERVAPRAAARAAVGGPFVPLDPAIMASPFGRSVEAARTDVTAAAELGRAETHVPFGKPLSGALEVTSPFGARLDPFMGRPALHTGVDLREDYGTDVRATAAGRIVAAGPTGGYGTMVEIDHGNGLTTRYAHLSTVHVEVGQLVVQGAVVGEVGSSGRATGPHLHYETRLDGDPVDPERFLQAGDRLAALLHAS